VVSACICISSRLYIELFAFTTTTTAVAAAYSHTQRAGEREKSLIHTQMWNARYEEAAVSERERRKGGNGGNIVVISSSRDHCMLINNTFSEIKAELDLNRSSTVFVYVSERFSFLESIDVVQEEI
jgi:hypothetical protein